MRYRILEDEGYRIVNLDSFAKRSETLYDFLRKDGSRFYTVEELHKLIPTLGSWNSIQRLVRHLERFDLVKVRQPTNKPFWRTRICLKTT